MSAPETRPRAIVYVDGFNLYYGSLKKTPYRWLHLAEVVVTEEKGTDVNLAAHLVYDAFSDAFDVAAVLSNNSDLVTPILLAREKCGKTAGVINPHKHPAQALRRVVDFYKKLRPGVLKASQLPPIVEHGGRRFEKPASW